MTSRKQDRQRNYFRGIVVLFFVALIVQGCAGLQSGSKNATQKPDSTSIDGRSVVGVSNTPGTPSLVSSVFVNTIPEVTANTTGPSPDPSEMASFEDSPERKFITDADLSHIAAKRLSEIALSHAKDTTIRNFASRILKEHSGANAALQALAAAKRIGRGAISAGSGSKDLDKKISKLTSANEKNFDQQYVRMMIRDYQKTVGLYEQASRSTDPAVKAYALKYLPSIKAHLNTAVSLN